MSNEQDQDADECFEDASAEQLQSFKVSGDSCDGDKPLATRLAETEVILRMALNNEFARALDICAQR